MGFRYNLPPYCVCDPISTENLETRATKYSSNNFESQKVKIRMSDGEDVVLDIKNTGTVIDIKSQLREKQNIEAGRRMVVLWCGRVLEDDISLGSLNLPIGAVLQVMVP